MIGPDSDYVVAGAGPAGLTIARLLALRGQRVVVLDEEAQKAKRLELLTPAARRTVAALGLEPLLHDKAITRPCLGILRRSRTRTEHEDFFRHPEREGYVVDRTRFDTCLRGAALAAGAEILPLRVTGVDPDSGALHIQTKAGAKGQWPIEGTTIDATGRAAAVARRKGAHIAFRERLVGELIEETPATALRPGANDAPSWLDFRSDPLGWSYCIRGPHGRVQTWRVRRAGAQPDKAVLSADASACLLSQAAGHKWIAVGDAAMSFDPIASQGLFNALSSALAAAGLLLSKEGLCLQTANAWSAAVAATFLQSEAGRASVYPT
jgi:flavin-dependent dehydrogenase